jgi:beta-lactamase regulating signal transducer with metallopeptidase domain
MMEALTTLGQSFGGMVFLKSTLIVSLVFALSFLLRKASAASRHFLWTLCFIALLALPLATYLSGVDGS